MKCAVCKNDTVFEKKNTEFKNPDGKSIVVSDLGLYRCPVCNETYFASLEDAKKYNFAKSYINSSQV